MSIFDFLGSLGSSSSGSSGSFGGRGQVPRVKTGPTYGQERSRNTGGEWRAKRSDAGEPRK